MVHFKREFVVFVFDQRIHYGSLICDVHFMQGMHLNWTPDCLSCDLISGVLFGIVLW